MPRFGVDISGKHLDRAMALLNGAGIPTIGSFPAYYGEQGPPKDWELDRLIAVVDAETADKAEVRVKDHLPDHTVGSARPLDWMV
jgi:hypothetical protein